MHVPGSHPPTPYPLPLPLPLPLHHEHKRKGTSHEHKRKGTFRKGTSPNRKDQPIMDISVCLDSMLTALDQEERDTAADHAADALEWLGRGGFRPDNAGTSYVDMVARSLHTSADEWSGDELGDESVSIVELDRWDRLIFSAATHADGISEDCHAAYLVTRLDGRGFVWPELIGTADPAISEQNKREAYERYEEIASGFYPPADDWSAEDERSYGAPD